MKNYRNHRIYRVKVTLGRSRGATTTQKQASCHWPRTRNGQGHTKKRKTLERRLPSRYAFSSTVRGIRSDIGRKDTKEGHEGCERQEAVKKVTANDAFPIKGTNYGEEVSQKKRVKQIIQKNNAYVLITKNIPIKIYMRI